MSPILPIGLFPGIVYGLLLRGTGCFDFRGNCQQLGHGAWWISAREHGAKDAVGVRFRTCLAQRLLIVHPSIGNHFFFARKAIEEAVPFVELRSEPVAIIRAERLALAELGRVRLAGNNLAYVAVDSGKELCGRILLVLCAAFLLQNFHLCCEFCQLLPEEGVQVPRDDRNG
jgi:hypothetical protein